MRKVVSFVVCALLTSANVRGQDAVDRHIEAVGGAAALEALQAMERSARATVTTPRGTFRGSFEEGYDLAGDRGVTTLVTRTFSVKTGWTGDDGWRDHSLQGFTVLDPARLALAKMSSTPSIIAEVVGRYGKAAVQPLESCTYVDQACDVVRFVGSAIEVLVGRDDYMILAVVVPDFGTYHFSDYQTVEGFRLPGSVTMQVPARQMTVRHEYIKTSFNGKLKDRRFKRPR